MKIGAGLILTVGASKKSNLVFMKDIKDVKEDEMLARAFGGLMMDGGYEKDVLTFQPPRSMSPKSSRSSCRARVLESKHLLEQLLLEPSSLPLEEPA
jgi:hypothetical protein